MKLGRILRNGKEEYGVIEDDYWFPQPKVERNNLGFENLFFESHEDIIDLGTKNFKVNDPNFRWLPPIARPGKIICVGRNYAEHSKEQGKDPEKKPLLFSKYSSSLTGHLSSIPFPKHTNYFDYEVELAVVIGNTAKKLKTNDNVEDFIFGFTIANDLTARDVQKSERQWTRGKAFDNSLPLGRSIVTVDEVGIPNNNEIWLTVNGDKRQLNNTNNMIFDIDYLIKYISQDITLFPGDILLTGTPEGVGYYMEPKQTLQPGDHVASGVTNIDELRFSIAK